MSGMGAMRSAGKVRFRSHIVAIAIGCLLNFSGGASADVGAALQNSVGGRVRRDGIDLFYKVVGPASGDYVLVLSGGPGEDIHSMEGIADELGKKYRCVMWEQRGTGRSKLPRYDSSTINLNAYMEDIEALRKQLHVDKFIVVGNSWGMILGLAYAGTHPDAVRAVTTIGSGPITFEYLGVFSDNQYVRLGPCDSKCATFGKSLHEKQLTPTGPHLNGCVLQRLLTSTTERRRCRWRLDLIPGITISAFPQPF